MSACGRGFTLVVTEGGVVRACGEGHQGQLGLSSREHQLLPARVGGREDFDARMVLVAAGRCHTAGVAADGAIFIWGDGRQGRLGHGDEE